MKGGKKPQGYTIVEVLIFVAVSGMMFILAAVFINGKQANVQFRQGILDLNSQIRTTINQVSNGEYEPLTNGSCSVIGANPPTISSPAAVSQGTNSGCIFLGKVMQFNIGNVDTKFNIYSLAARQFDASGNAVTSFAGALPVPITAPIDLTVRRTTPSNLSILHSYLCSDPTCMTVAPISIGAFGIFGSFNNSLGVASGAQQSGSQSVTVSVIPGTMFGDTEANTISRIKSNTRAISGGDIIGGGKFILLCLTDGTKKASLTIGGSNGQQFTTEVKTNSVFVVGTPHAC